MVFKLLEKISSFIFPHGACLLCLSTDNVNGALCESCITALPWIQNACIGCGLVLAKSRTGTLCGPCLIKPFPFDLVKVAFEYKWPCDRFVSQLKFKKKLEIATLLGHLMATYFKTHLVERPSCLIPVPLHPQRLKERGFNQAYVLAKIIGRVLNIPVVWDFVKKTKQTRAQSSLSLDKRVLNLQRAFEISSNFPTHFKSSVAIIDDVMTTGQTLSSLTLALKAAGVERVEVWCACRTLKSTGVTHAT